MANPILAVKSKTLKAPSAATVVAYTPEPGLARSGKPHPCLTKNTASMHDDAGASDASIYSGPYEKNATIRYFENKTQKFGGICASTAIDDAGRLITMSFTKERTTLVVMDPQLLEPTAAFEIPPRDTKTITAIFNVGKIFKSTAGAYFCVDNHARIIVPTTKREIWLVEQRPEATTDEYFRLQRVIKTDTDPKDSINCTVPVWDATPHGPLDAAPSGYWFTTESGKVGVARPTAQPQVKTIELPANEKINNGAAISENGLYVVTNVALYRLQLVGGKIEIVRRTEYENGVQKPGQPFNGSGTTPTLLGNDFVAIGNGAKTMEACIYHQTTLELLDSRPVFADAIGSACDNSFVGVKTAKGYAIVVSNTFGYHNPMQMDGFVQSKGITRLDVDELGRFGKDATWARSDISMMSALPKVSIPRGLVYGYSMRWLEKPKKGPKDAVGSKGKWEWSVVGIDFATGKTVYKQPIYSGSFSRNQDNGWGTIALTPNGSFVVGMWRGMLRVGPP